MKLHEAAQALTAALTPLYGDSEASAITVLTLEFLTGRSRTEQLMRKDEALSQQQLEQFKLAKERLLTHEPVQYLMNRAWFYGLELYVDRDVLIPRPETEELVDWVISDQRPTHEGLFERKGAQADQTRALKIMDIGTGSGCIALALKKAMPLAEIWGCDISDRALNIARRNGAELDIRVDFQSVNFLDPAQQKHLPTVDVIVSNPPYIPRRDEAGMLPNVVQFEPHMALFVENDDPLLFYRAIAEFSAHRLYDGGRIYMEIHEDLAKEVSALFREAGYTNVEVRNDMQGKPRMVKVRR